MNISSIMQQLDQLYASGNRHEIERFLIEKREQSIREHDISARIMLQNEMIGLYRTLGAFARGREIFSDTCNLFRQIGMTFTVPYAGTLLNGASLLRAEGSLTEALEYFRQVQDIYERELREDDYRLAGFYNNFGLLYLDVNKEAQALELLQKALCIVEKLPDSTVEQATSHTTLSNLALSLGDLSMAEEHLKAADHLFAKVDYKDPHYASYLSASARYLYRQGKLAAAANQYRRALKEIEQYHGRNRSYEITQNSLNQVLEQLRKEGAE